MRMLPVFLLSVALSACTVGPDYERPSVSLTTGFQTPVALSGGDSEWWRGFDDPILNRVVDRVATENLDLSVAAARIAQARAVARASGAALLPSVDVGGSAQSVRQSLRTPFGAAASSLGFPRGYELYEVGGQASWEIDLFGGLSRRREAAGAELGAAEADAAAVRLSVVAEAVDAYLQLRGLQARLVVAERQLEVRRSLVMLVGQRVAEGVSPERDLNRAKGDAEGVEASLSPLRAAVLGQINRLSILMGEQAGSRRDELMPVSAVPSAIMPSGSDAPIDLLRRRPDIVAAERRLAASNARIGAAMADYYPKLSLSGLLGFASVGTNALFSGDSLQASGGAGLRWRLFDFGRVDAQVGEARGKEAEALATYRSSVLHATEDVENAFIRLIEGRNEVRILEQQVGSLRKSRAQVQAAYEAGAVALLDVLDADRALLDASDKLEQAKTQEARASVSAVRALGGGFKES